MTTERVWISSASASTRIPPPEPILRRGWIGWSKRRPRRLRPPPNLPVSWRGSIRWRRKPPPRLNPPICRHRDEARQVGEESRRPRAAFACRRRKRAEARQGREESRRPGGKSGLAASASNAETIDAHGESGARRLK